MSTTDAVIEEIRESRRRMSAECGHDPSRYVEYLKRFNEKYSVQVEAYRESCRRHPAESRSPSER